MSVRFRSSALSDRGRVRRNDEDAYLADEDLGLFAVADGMGGHLAGEVASRIAVEVLSASVRRVTDAGGAVDAKRALEEAFRSANEETRRQARSADRRGMGSTLVALYAPSSSAWTAHVGDSRVYLWRNKELKRLTQDHSAVTELARRTPGLESELRRSALAHVLTRCLGMEGEAVPEIRPVQIEPGDRLLLCCDGLTDMVSDEELGRILSSGLSADALCRSLVEMANEAGGQDNITVVVVDVESDESRDDRRPG